jgi:2-haloacid dehalogenase
MTDHLPAAAHVPVDRGLSTAVFDLGGVLVDWDPHHLYRRLMPEEEVEPFLDEIGFHEWNRAQDAGRGWAEAVADLAARHPRRRELIAAYAERYDEAIAGEVAGTVVLLDELADRGIRLLALTNWSAETFPAARRRFPFLERFDGIVVSGEELVAKPDPELFRRLLERYQVDAAETVFVDDSPANVEAARRLGMTGLQFTDAERLRADLAALGLVSPKPPRSGPATSGRADGA